MKKNIFWLLLILLSFNGTAQTLPDSLSVNVAAIGNIRSIEPVTEFFSDTHSAVAIEQVPLQSFTRLSGLQSNHIRARMVTKPVYLHFKAFNPTGRKISFYYFPGSLYSRLELFEKTVSGQMQKKDFGNKNHGFVYIELAPNQHADFYIRGEFSRSMQNELRSQVIAPEFLPFYKMETNKTLVTKKVIGITLSGALCMMILFTLVNYFLNGKIEFLYNCLYSVCMFFLIFLTAYLSRDSGWLKIFFIEYLDLLLLITGTFFYLAFTRKFLNTKTIHPKLDKFLIAEQWSIVVMMGAYTALHFMPHMFIWEDLLENIMKLFILAASVIFVIIAMVEKNRLMNYLAIGTSVQIFFYLLSFIFIHAKVNLSYIFTSPILYFEFGVIVAMFFFLLGLTYKNKTEIIEKIKEQEAMKLEVEKKGFETQLAVLNAQQEERNRISADMHDDLGAGMTTIRLYSELAKGKLGANMIPEIEKISHSANELLDKMNAIIWSMSSSNDTLGNMIAYIRSYALEYLEDSNLKANINIPTGLPEIEVPGKIRRNVFLVVKEALHNIVKHAQATEVDIVMEQHEQGFSLTIHDNGVGIDLDNIRTFGNGLNNMKKRMEDVNIQFEIWNNNGTTIRFFRKIKGTTHA